MEIYERIKARRKELGLSAEEVADKIGVSAATYYRYESNDIKKLPTDVLTDLAKVLHTTPSFLMGWDENISPEEQELQEYLEELRTRPEMKMLFSLSKKATKEEVEQAVRIIEALRGDQRG